MTYAMPGESPHNSLLGVSEVFRLPNTSHIVETAREADKTILSTKHRWLHPGELLGPQDKILGSSLPQCFRMLSTAALLKVGVIFT